MTKNIMMMFLLLGSLSIPGQTFQDFLNRVSLAPDSLKMSIVDSFMSAVPGFPYREQDTLAHFLYRGNASQITIPGDANQWNPASFPMIRITGTNLWYNSHTFEADARLDYKFVLTGSSWILDPLNPLQVSGGYGPNSELQMPLYIPPPEVEYYAWYPHGTFFDTSFYSINLGNSRTIRVYQPPFYQTSTDSFPVILFHDGLEYVSLGRANNVLDYLIYHQLIRPVIAVFVPPVDRTAEYAGNLKPQFSAFIVNEVFPWLESRFRVLSRPEYRATLGASNGGNIALWLGLNYPQVFGNIAAYSSNVEDVIASGFNNGPFLPLNLYLDRGSYDIPIIITRVNNFVQILASRGYPFRFQLYHEGHSWGSWRAHIDNALQMFFPGSALSLPSSAMPVTHFELLPNFPNPFNASTVISFRVRRSALVKVRIFTSAGQQVRFLGRDHFPPGTYRLIWDGRDGEGHILASGIYLLTVESEGMFMSRKMILLK